MNEKELKELKKGSGPNIAKEAESQERKESREESKRLKQKENTANIIIMVALILFSIAFVYPVFMILFNSFKVGSAFSTNTAFKLPTGDTFSKLDNYIDALNSKGFLQSLFYSFFITVTSVAAILLCCSMCAWFISRIRNWLTEILYYIFVFSMIVPFQMVMFTLSKTADRLNLDTPYVIWIIYLGFGAGLAVFMFCGFLKSIPIEIEEAAMIDGCNPIQTFFMIVVPMLKPTMISVGILEAMWVWNDYLLPYLVLDIKKYKTVPMLIQYFRGSYGKVEWGPLMACIMLTIIPIVIVYIAGQKHIIKGVAAGAVKG